MPQNSERDEFPEPAGALIEERSGRKVGTKGAKDSRRTFLAARRQTARRYRTLTVSGVKKKRKIKNKKEFYVIY